MGKPDEPLPRPARRPVTVTTLARSAGLSRSTLLYYDRIGLLRPSARSAAGYRLYMQADAERLARIVELRATGLSLADIRAALDRHDNIAKLLRQQAEQLDAEARSLGERQQALARMLDGQPEAASQPRLDKQAWTAMFRAIGLSDDDMRHWHAQFERSRPEAHRAFLASLGIPAADIERIRRWARASRPAA